MKRVREEEEYYSGSRGLEILELLMYYGFEHVPNIVTCAYTTKALLAKATKTMLTKCSCTTMLIFGNQYPEFLLHTTYMPSKGLLKVHPNLILMKTELTPFCSINDIKHASYTITIDSRFCIHHFYENRAFEYTEFKESPYMKTTMRFVKNNQRVNAIELFVSLAE